MSFAVRPAPILIAVLALAGAVALTATAARAELTAAQKKSVMEIAGLVREAATLYQADDFQASGQRIEAAMDAIETLIREGGPEAYDAVSPAFSRIINAHALLELEGVTLRPFERPERPEPAEIPSTAGKGAADKPEPTTQPAAIAMPAPTPRTRPGRPLPEPAAADSGPSFVRQIAPILVEHCGRCHINATRGNFNMANFALLAKGPPEGRVVLPGDTSSRLIETIETGDMPRGGGKVPPNQLQLLKDWVLAGAKFDGPSPTIPLVAMAAGAPASAGSTGPAAPPADPAIRPPSGKETVSFAKDVAPLLLANCNGCHIDAMQTRGGLRMDSFAALMRGGDSGEIVSPNRAAASLLIRKLKGEEGARMPAGGRPPLSDDAIALISTWIEEGAAFDGQSAEQPLGIMASLAWANSASAKELSERRMQLAKKNMQLIGASAEQVVEHGTEAFYVIGDVSEATAQALATAATKATGKLKSFADPAAIRGRVTVFAFPKRYDYSEFAKMVEQRSVPTDWQSHWKYDGVDAYVAVVATSSDSDAALESKLIGPLTSLAIAMRGADVPRWFAEGVGRAATAKVAARESQNVDLWNRNLPAAVSAMKDGAQFVKNGLPPEQTDLIGFGIANTMLSRNQRRQYDALLRELTKAPSFDAAFATAFGAPPAAYVDKWKPYALSGGDSRRR